MKLLMKQGDTKTFQITITDSAGTPIDVTSATLTCQLKNGDTLLDTLTVSKVTPASGVISISIQNENSANYPVTDARNSVLGDIKRVTSGEPVHSSTFEIVVEKAITA